MASGCAGCPKLRCERPGCASYFCYHCKATWHPNQTCDAARAERSANVRSSTFNRDSQNSEYRVDILVLFSWDFLVTVTTISCTGDRIEYYPAHFMVTKRDDEILFSEMNENAEKNFS